MIYNEDALSVLFVDDEQNLLDAISRHFRRQYNVYTANSGADALALMKSEGPFPIVISDMRMPRMSGVELLKTIRIQYPDTIRILLTGQAGMNDAINAINEGNIFRFLTKPCSLGTLGQTLEAARRQFDLVANQRILLEQTLQGSIRILVDMLALTNPTAFGKTDRTRQAVMELLPHIDLEGVDRWPIEVAAMLSQLGYVSLAPDLVEKVYKGDPLTADETALVDRLPEVAESLLAHIPRIESVREILRYQNKGYDGRGVPNEDMSGDRLPIGARILKIVLDFDRQFSQSGFLEPALSKLLKEKKSYDPHLLEAFIEVKRASAGQEEIRNIEVRYLQIGMIFATDIVSSAGHLLVARGQEVTPSLKERMLLLAENGAIGRELTMIIPPPPPEPEAEAQAMEDGGAEGDGQLANADDTLPILSAPAGQTLPGVSTSRPTT